MEVSFCFLTVWHFIYFQIIKQWKWNSCKVLSCKLDKTFVPNIFNKKPPSQWPRPPTHVALTVAAVYSPPGVVMKAATLKGRKVKLKTSQSREGNRRNRICKFLLHITSFWFSVLPTPRTHTHTTTTTPPAGLSIAMPAQCLGPTLTLIHTSPVTGEGVGEGLALTLHSYILFCFIFLQVKVLLMAAKWPAQQRSLCSANVLPSWETDNIPLQSYYITGEWWKICCASLKLHK